MASLAQKPVRVYVDRQELIGYTDLTLTRKKDDLTGSLSIGIFMGYLPSEPVVPGATAGREIHVYINNYLAFSGNIDKRSDKADRSTEDEEGSDNASQDGYNLNIGPNQYTVTFTARGKTKYLIDSSHQHETGTMLRPTNKDIFAELVKPWGIKLDWQASVIKLDKQRFRDGARVVDELHRVAEQCSLYVTETIDGKLRVTDETETPRTAEPLILGQNILSFNTTQDEHIQRSAIKVKGQRIEKDVWGDVAVIPTLIRQTQELYDSFIPETVQLYGNATEELLERRSRYEANKRNALGKTIKVDVFHVQQTNYEPWDVGLRCPIDIPPAGVSGTFEITEVQYTVQADETLKTTLTFSPPPAPGGRSSALKKAAKSGENEGNWNSASMINRNDDPGRQITRSVPFNIED